MLPPRIARRARLIAFEKRVSVERLLSGLVACALVPSDRERARLVRADLRDALGGPA